MALSFDVALEGAVFALIQVHPGHEAEFDRWYTLDHFYSGGVLGPGVLSGRRWSAGRDLRANRYVAEACLLPDPYAGNHLAVYWLTAGGLDAFFAWVRPQLALLRAEGRMFEARTHVNVDGYRAEQGLAHRGASRVAPVLALDHDFAGLFVTYGEHRHQPQDSEADLPAGSLAVTFRPAAGALSNAAVQTAPGSPGLTFPTAGEPVRMTMLFLPMAPAADAGWSEHLARTVATAAGCEPLWGGGFTPIDPGTDRHLKDMV
jgi:hypothetical protein